jgi:hypothetical protein
MVLNLKIPRFLGKEVYFASEKEIIHKPVSFPALHLAVFLSHFLKAGNQLLILRMNAIVS